MKAGQLDAAYNLLSSRCKASTTKEQLRDYWELEEKNKGNLKGWLFHGFRIHYNFSYTSINFTYTLRYANGYSTIRIGCEEENGKWLILGIDYNS